MTELEKYLMDYPLDRSAELERRVHSARRFISIRFSSKSEGVVVYATIAWNQGEEEYPYVKWRVVNEGALGADEAIKELSVRRGGEIADDLLRIRNPYFLKKRVIDSQLLFHINDLLSDRWEEEDEDSPSGRRIAALDRAIKATFAKMGADQFVKEDVLDTFRAFDATYGLQCDRLRKRGYVVCDAEKEGTANGKKG